MRGAACGVSSGEGENWSGGWAWRAASGPFEGGREAGRLTLQSRGLTRVALAAPTDRAAGQATAAQRARVTTSVAALRVPAC